MKFNHLFLLLFILFSLPLMSQDSLNMTRLGQWNPPGLPSIGSDFFFNDIWGYTASDGSEYAIIGNVDSIFVVDVSNCSNPQQVYSFDGGETNTWRDFKTYGDYAYAVCDGCNEGLHVFDLSALPGGNVSHVLTTTAFFGQAHNIFIDTATAKLYATLDKNNPGGGSSNDQEGLVILDLTTPDNPTMIDTVFFDELVGDIAENYYVHDLYVQNDTAYCSHGYLGYYVWDMTNLNNIVLLGDYDTGGYNHSSWNHSSGTYAYYAEEVPAGRPMGVIDLTNLGDPVNDIQLIHTFKDPITTVETDLRPHNPFVHNDTLYISYYEDGMKVYDLTDPTTPTLIGYYDTYPDNGTAYGDFDGAWGTYPFLDSGCLLISDITYGLNTMKMDCASETNFYRDADQDGYGDPNVSVFGCVAPNGYITDNTDCDDTNDLINPAAVEICDGIDNDCDGMVDEGCAMMACDGDSLVITVLTQDSFYAKQHILATAEISSLNDVKFAAAIDMVLEAGFEVSAGTTFEAVIEDCID